MMKTGLGLVLLLACAAEATAGSATFYDHRNYGGKDFTVYSNNSVHSTSREYGFHDQISSLKVTSGTCAILFTSKGFEGDIRYFPAGSYSDLGSYNFNNKTSSLHVIDSYYCDSRDLSTLWRHSNFNGPGFSVPIGYSSRVLKGGDFFNRDYDDDITSVTVGQGACVKLYRDKYLSDQYLSITSNTAGLGSSHDFGDKASSFVVLRNDDPLCKSSTTTGNSNSGGNGGGGRPPIGGGFNEIDLR